MLRIVVVLFVLFVSTTTCFSFLPVYQPLPKELAGIVSLTSIDHFCTVVKDFNYTATNFAQVFGTQIVGSLTDDYWTYYNGAYTNAKAILIHIPIGSSGDVKWEVLQPADQYPSFWRQLLNENGDFFHHVAVAVQDIDKIRTTLQSLGYPIVQSGQGPWGCYAYLDARKQLGVVLELLAPGATNCAKP